MPKDIATEKTHIRCKVIIEVLGKPKEHVENSIRLYVDKIKEDSDLILLSSKFADAEEKAGLWSTFVELEMVVKGITKLIAFCFDYMPSSVQVLKPESYMLERATIEDFENDLQARLHHVDMIIKKQKNENDFLRKNMNTSVKNSILIALSFGKFEFKTLSKATGIHDNELKLFLDSLLKDDKIKEDNGIYSLNIKYKNAEEQA